EGPDALRQLVLEHHRLAADHPAHRDRPVPRRQGRDGPDPAGRRGQPGLRTAHRPPGRPAQGPRPRHLLSSEENPAMTSFGDVHHVGITVRDLEESLQWYERIFDVKPEFIAEGTGPDLARAIGVPDVNLRFAFLRFGSCVLELLHYDNDRQETFDR